MLLKRPLFSESASLLLWEIRKAGALESCGQITGIPLASAPSDSEAVVIHLKSRSNQSQLLSCFSACWIHLEVLWRERQKEEEELQRSDKSVKIPYRSVSRSVG